jgi:hypothetical protein
MNLLYHWLSGSNHTQLCTIGGHSSPTITAFMKYFKQVSASDVKEELCKIGGTNVIVEMDESKFAKRKHNRVHHVNGVWIIGGVERTEERKIFACIVENRNADTIKRIVYTHVHSGSQIYTDQWKGYDWIDKYENYTHSKVNHSLHFKNPDTGSTQIRSKAHGPE